ncbi:MAG: glycosyltransferase family 2 protein [Ornithinimicrobium sp.]
MPTDEPLAGGEDHLPGVSVVMPVRNEATHLGAALASVFAQDYRGPIEVVIAVGHSRDGTREIAEQSIAAHPSARIVSNPSGRTPDALNAAIAASSHPVVARVDAHGALPPDYLSTAIPILMETGSANIGGRAIPEGVSLMQRAIAVAMGSPLGMGAARFRVGGAAGEAETVFPGVFQREWLERVGGFNPEYERAQDWEMNLRIRQAGGIVWFTPQLCVTYHPRRSLGSLAQQFYATGQWRRRLSREQKGALNGRYLAPPALVLILAGAFALAPVWPAALLLPAGYAAVLAGGGVLIASKEPWAVRLRVPGALATMHVSWGSGFLVGAH